MRTQSILLWGGLAAAVGLYAYSRTSAGADAAGGVADALGGAASAVSDYVDTLINGPRGIRNNNPGNIIRSGINWQGALTPDQVTQAGGTYDAKFVQFDTPDNGVRALGHVLLSKSARGLVSVDQIIRDYSATDQDAYVANVASALGVEPSEVIDVQGRLPDLAAAIIQQENGQQPYPYSSLQEWVYA